MGYTMLFVFLPRTLLYLCQNWVESLDSFKNFVLYLCCLSFASEMVVWYFSLTSSIFHKFAGDCLNLYLLTVTDSFISFLAALMLLFHQPLALLCDISVWPKKLVAEPTIRSVNLLACWSLTSEISRGKFVE